MIIENFRNGDAKAVYRRFRDHGRLAPDGLTYVSSWVDENFQRCFQLMESPSLELLEQWMSAWQDLVEFEVYPVVTSTEAAQRIGPSLDSL